MQSDGRFLTGAARIGGSQPRRRGDANRAYPTGEWEVGVIADSGMIPSDPNLQSEIGNG